MGDGNRKGLSMMRLRNLLFGGGIVAAIGILAALAPATAATAGQAPGQAPGQRPAVGTDVIRVGAACNAYSCWNNRLLYNPINRPFYRNYTWPIYRPYRPAPPYYRPTFSPYSPGVSIYRPYDTPHYVPPVYRSGYSSHVTWCTNRYRTYNRTTDRFHAGGGVYPLCVSPYR